MQFVKIAKFKTLILSAAHLARHTPIHNPRNNAKSVFGVMTIEYEFEY